MLARIQDYLITYVFLTDDALNDVNDHITILYHRYDCKRYKIPYICTYTI